MLYINKQNFYPCKTSLFKEVIYLLCKKENIVSTIGDMERQDEVTTVVTA